MIDKGRWSAHICQCAKCVEQPSSAPAQLHQQINQLAALLNEKERRQFVGLLARQLGRGGVTRMAEVTGLDRNTIRRGQQEIAVSDFSDRVRRKGGGRPLTEKKPLAC
jgi:hypothetical protein